MINESDIMSFRMIVCSECKKAGENLLPDNELCRSQRNEIIECLFVNTDWW